MHRISAWLQQVWRQTTEIWSTQPLTVLLFIGLVALSVGLLLAMKTRFCQTKPLWTCAILSVLAHILLIGYAYGTKIFSALPATADIVQFQLIEQSTTFEPGDQLIPPPETWDDPPLEQLPEELVEPEMVKTDPPELHEPLTLDEPLAPPQVEDQAIAPDTFITATTNLVPDIPPIDDPDRDLAQNSRPSESHVDAQELPLRTPHDPSTTGDEHIQPLELADADELLDVERQDIQPPESDELIPIQPGQQQLDIDSRIQELANSPIVETPKQTPDTKLLPVDPALNWRKAPRKSSTIGLFACPGYSADR